MISGMSQGQSGYMNPDFFHLDHLFWKTSVDLMNRIMTIAIQLAAPSLVAIWMAETF